MSTRPYNLRMAKRQRISTSGVYRDRVELDDDIEVIHSREAGLSSSRRVPTESPRSPQKGRGTTWVLRDSWGPADSTEVGLDPSTAWFDEQMEAPVTENPQPPPKKKRIKSTQVVCLPGVQM